jgi:hypothetical protein
MSFAVAFDLAIVLLGKFAAAIPAATAAPAPIVIAGKKSKHEQSKRKGFLAWIAETLHHSRRIQAQRFLWSHRHLIAGREESYPGSNTGDKNVDR